MPGKGNRNLDLGSPESSKKDEPKRATPRCSIIKVAKLNKDRVLKAAREKQLVIFKGTPVRPSVDFKETAGQKRVAQYIQV